MEADLEVKNVICELQSGHGSNLYSALIMIRTTLIKSKNSLTQLVQMGAVKLLVQVLEDRRRHKNQTKTTDIVMSILANLCLEEDVREQVVCCDGLSVIARVTLSAEQESIQNRGVRALANLALDVSNCEKIFQMEVPAFVAKRLMESEDVECRSTYCRALQLFGQTGKDAKRLMEETQAIQALAALLKLDNRKLALKSLRILSELSALCCCASFTGQILAANILEELVTLADDEDSSSASCSLSIILRLCEQEIMRPALGSAGIISLLVKLMRSDKSCVSKVLALNAVCLCTKEAVNRNKIQEAGGLELFISALNINEPGLSSEGQFSVLYDRIISSLVNFLYNDECLGKLLELGLVNILLEHLKRSCSFSSVGDELKSEIDFCAVSLESCSGDRGGHLEGGSKSNTAGVGGSACHKDDSVAMDKTSAATSFSLFPGTSMQTEDTRDDPKSNYLEFPSSTPVLQDGIDHVVVRGVPREESNIDDERGDSVVDKSSDEMIADVEVELLTSSRNRENPFQHSDKARHTFSINSPTYQMETAWRLEDYTSGVTCKSFNLDPESHRTSQHHSSSSPYSLNADLLQAPYSPLSAGASYYSPSQSSTSPSVLLSPIQSTFPSSPSSVSYRGSPTWAYSSPENENIPASAARLFSPHSSPSMSPLSLAYQNQFSPLSNTFPASPLHLFGERYSQSPTQSSQNSLFSQSTFLERSEPMGLDQLLVSSRTTSEAVFTAAPLSQGASEHIYSASEDDDDDDSVRNVGSEPNPSANIGDRFANEDVEFCLEGAVAGCSTSDNTNRSVKSAAGSVGLVSHKRSKTVNNSTFSTGGSAEGQHDVKNAEASKRRRLNHVASVIEPARAYCSEGPCAESASKAVDNSRESASNTGLSDDDEIKSLPHKFTVVNSATCSLKRESGFHEMLPVVTEGETEMQRPTSACSTPGFEKPRQRSFQRLASFPGKEKRLVKTSHFRKHLSGTLPSKPRIPGSPAASLLPGTHMSDSPYRSPYAEPAHNDNISSQGIKGHSETKTQKVIIRSNSHDLFSSPLPENSSKASDINESRREVSTSSKKETAGRSDQSIDEARVRKIRRTTEANILILLARVSVKINPTQLAESTVVSCLLGYIASAPNPIRRSCRILYRLCSNPHCFEKLILMQMPALIVKTLVLENDGTFPHSLFCSDNRNIMDFLPSSQGSECSGSQTSEFGRRMDFEFSGDAYSKLTSKVHSSIRSIFQNRHILVVDSEALRVNQGGDDIYEVGSSRAESCVRIGLELLYTLGAVAMSKFGEGEIQHLLARHSTQNKLACVISLLHLQVGWCAVSRDKFFTKYSLWDKVLPYLFAPEAPLVRETIVAAISLNVHLDNPGKLTKLVPKLPVCPDLQSTSRRGRAVNEQFDEHVNSRSKSDMKPSLRNAEKTPPHADDVGSLKKISNEFVTDGLRSHEQNASESRWAEKMNNTASCRSKTDTLCPYQNMSVKHDVCFSVADENNCVHKVHAQRKILVERSEVFAAMFSGSYAESVQSEINVPDVSKDAFEFIIHYLHGCSSECPLIASLSMEYVKNKIVTAEVGVRSDGSESSSAANQDDEIMCDEEQNGTGGNDSICVVNDSSKSELEAGRKRSDLASAERCVRTDASANISQVLEFTQSQDSLDSLTLEDRPHGDETSHACRKLSFKNPFTGGDNDDTGGQSSEEIARQCFDELITRCENILELADRFLLHDLMMYPASVLAHVCLSEHTVEDIFHLACFYHLDSLAFDCIRETLMSCLPCSDAAAIYMQLAKDGYREQVHTALQWLVNRIK